MNTITLRVRLDSYQKFSSDKGSSIVRGIYSFRFYDERTMKTRPMAFTAFGNAAVAIEQGGVGSVHLITGRLDIFPPSQDNPNHQMMLTVDKACPEPTASAVPATTVPIAVPATVPVAPVVPAPEPNATVPVPSVTVQPRVPVGASTAAATSNGAYERDLDDIPF